MPRKDRAPGVDYAHDVEPASSRRELGDTPLIEEIMDNAVRAKPPSQQVDCPCRAGPNVRATVTRPPSPSGSRTVGVALHRLGDDGMIRRLTYGMTL